MTEHTQIPPHDLDAEAAVASCVLIDQRTLPIVSKVITPQDMYSESHRRILEAAMAIHERGEPVDLVTVVAQLQNTDRLEQVGGCQYLFEISNSAPHIANAESYARIVKEHAIARRAIARMQLATARLYARTSTPEETIEELRSDMTGLTAELLRSSDRGLEPLHVVAKRAIRQMAERLRDGMRLPTGLAELDSKIDGLHRGELTVVAARPGVGKTSFAVSIALNLARYGHVLFFSLEMPKEQIAQRSMCILEGMQMRDVRSGGDVVKLQNAINRACALPIELEQRTRSPSDILGMVNDRKRELEREGKNISCVIIDQLSKMRHPTASRDDAAIGRTTSMLASGALAIDVPIVLLHQVNRSVESRENKRPTMSDLKNSGCIEEDANNVLLLYRDDYYNPDSESRGIAEVIIGKQRNGPDGVVRVAFDAQSTTFRNLLRAV